jgi:methionine-rich copper-binding protein CopC
MLTLAVLLGALLGTIAVPAFAHSELEASTPASNARLAKPPEDIKLQFNQEISPQFVDVSLSVDGGEPRPLATSVNGRSVVAKVPDTLGTEGVRGPASWLVGYRVVSADGHPISGEVKFQAPVAADASPATAAPPVPSSVPTPEEQPTPTSDAHSTPADASSETGGNAILSTLILGGLAAAVALGSAAWLTRARRESTEK